MNKRLPIDDAIILIKNKCAENNYDFLGFDDSNKKYNRNNYLNYKTRLILKCKYDASIRITTFNWFVNNVIICQKCNENKNIKIVEEKCKRKNYQLLSTEIKQTRTKLLFKCNIDNHEWYSSFDNFIRNDSNCPKCDKNFQLPIDDITLKIIKRCNELNYSFLNFSEDCFKNVHSKLSLICECNHNWSPTYYQFIYKKQKCPRCQKVHNYSKEEMEMNLKRECSLRNYNFVEFVGEYKTTKSKIILNCGKHENWSVSCTNFLLNKNGCPFCPNNTNSKGEKHIGEYLKNHNMKYLKQHKFINCKNKKKLPFDYYLFEYNTCIEYDGQQHFFKVDCWGGADALIKIQINDEIKTQYCLNNGIKLLRIKYNENIDNKLNEFFIENI